VGLRADVQIPYHRRVVAFDAIMLVGAWHVAPATARLLGREGRVMSDLSIRNARLRDGTVHDIAIADGEIVAIDERGPTPAAQELDAGGALVLPGLVDPHLHLDKVLTSLALPARAQGTFEESIELTLDARRRYTNDDLLERGTAVLEQAIVHGTTALRAFADVGTVGGLTPVKAVLALRERYRPLLDMQVVAFPQEGLLRDPGAADLLVEAMELGADVVGAFPWFELSDRYASEHLRQVFEIARRFDADIHALVDDEPLAPHTRNLEQLALVTIEAGWQRRVVASHACGLASIGDHAAARLTRLVRDAGISICANAHVSLVSKCEHAPEPVPRGITRVRQLMAHGVNVTCGQDDVADPYYPFGRADMLEVAGYLAHTAHLYRPEQAALVIDAITENAARAMRLGAYGLHRGARADLVVFAEGHTASELLRLQPARRWVVKSGRVVAETKVSRTLLRG
jgi:cytosine deaminase